MNSVVRTFQPYYDHITAVSSCPRVVRDTARNKISCGLSRKDQIATALWDALRGGSPNASDDNKKKEEGSSPWHVLITAGRHGLHPTTVKALCEAAQSTLLSDLLYVSCNVESMIRDVYLFQQTMSLVNVRTFDFFPQTAYVMTVMHWRPRSPLAVLVLPVGPPGSGKSSTAQALASDSFGQMMSKHSTEKWKRRMEEIRRASKRQQCRQRRQGQSRDEAITPAAKQDPPRIAAAAAAPPPPPLIPRHVDPTITVSPIRFVAFERDVAFAEERSKSGATLSATKRAVHQRLLDALKQQQHSPPPPSLISSGVDGSCSDEPLSSSSSSPSPSFVDVMYLDSTNGSIEARELYQKEFEMSHGCSPNDGSFSSRTIELWFLPCSSGIASSDVPTPHSEGLSPSPSFSSSPFLSFDAVSVTKVTDTLLQRCRLRTGHPSFPTDEEEQRRKIETVLHAIEAPAEFVVSSTVRNQKDAASDAVPTLTAAAPLHSAKRVWTLRRQQGKGECYFALSVPPPSSSEGEAVEVVAWGAKETQHYVACVIYLFAIVVRSELAVALLEDMRLPCPWERK